MESTANASSLKAYWYERVKTAADHAKAVAEAAWTAPLFGSRPLMHPNSFEAALKDAAYVPPHLKPLVVAHKEADPVSVMDHLESSGSDTQSSCPSTPRAEPAVPAAAAVPPSPFRKLISSVAALAPAVATPAPSTPRREAPQTVSAAAPKEATPALAEGTPKKHSAHRLVVAFVTVAAVATLSMHAAGHKGKRAQKKRA